MLRFGGSGARVWAWSACSCRRERAKDGTLAVTFREISGACLLDCGGEPRTQVSQFGFFPFEESQTGTENFTGILVATGRNEPVDQFGLRGRQDNVSGGHGADLLDGRLAIYGNDLRPYIPIVRTTVA